VQRLDLYPLGRAADGLFGNVADIGDGVADQRVERRIPLGRGVGDVVAEIAPDLFLRRLPHHADQVEQ
jgi:hypothetical protein